MMKCGTVIHTEKPFVHLLSSNLRKTKCDNCYGEYELLKCSGCSYVKYCDRTCQKSAWNHHKNECKYLKKLHNGRELPDTAILLCRLIFKLKKGGDQEKGHFDKNKFRFFKDLMSHYPQIKEDGKRMEHAVSLYAVLKDFIGDGNLPNFSEFTGIYGRVVINSFNILDGEMNNLGTGIYLGASTLDHSCEPNAIAMFSGTTITIRTIKDIPDYKWSKVRISYIEVLKSTEERLDNLQRQYYFLCDCPRCNSLTFHYTIESTLQCQKCSFPVDTQRDDLKCTNCQWEVPNELLKNYDEIVKFTKAQHSIMDRIAYLDACKICLSKQKGIFHQDNLMFVKTMDLAFEASIQMERWEDSLLFAETLAEGYRKYYGDIHPILGLHYLKYGKILLLKNEFEKALSVLELAQGIILTTHGAEHELYKSQLYRLMFDAKSALYSSS